MSVARTARRRRKQASLGKRGLEQVFGKRHAPHYRKVSDERSRKTVARIAALVKKGLKV